MNRPAPDLSFGAAEGRLIATLSEGGDERIALDPRTGLNRYFSAPYPRDILAYSSSTVSDISRQAFTHLLTIPEPHHEAAYAKALDQLRGRLRSAYSLPQCAQIAFAASGTDLEFVALAAVAERAPGGVHNVLLGADEVGSGCVNSARGCHFAHRTALGIAVEPGQPVAGCGPVTMVDIPVRCERGEARSSAEVTASIRTEIMAAKRSGRHPLIHGVHGSKTGLVLPSMHDLDALQKDFGSSVSFVIDACQARITSEALAEYLTRGCIVLITGSKFIGAPPFNGFAIVPESEICRAVALPEGFSDIFRRAEFPPAWPGQERLRCGANPSLALRLEAAMFELERFQKVPIERIGHILDAFDLAVDEALINPLRILRVLPHSPGCESRLADRPIEMRTLTTLDVSTLAGFSTFEDAGARYRTMAIEHGVRVGQPVKCVRQADGWGGTLRIGLSMPMISGFAAMDDETVRAKLQADFRIIADLLMAP